jgi:hypothetical protein
MKTITGTFTKPDGTPVANGRVVFRLSRPAVVIATLAQVSPAVTSFTLNSSGVLSGSLLANDELTPADSTYSVSVRDVNDVPMSREIRLSVEGASPIDIGAAIAGIITPDSGAPGVAIVTYSATPAFDVSLLASQQITLTGNVSSSTISGGFSGRYYTFSIVQDAVGGRTFVWPTSFQGGVSVDTTALAKTTQIFWFNGTNYIGFAASVTT